MFISCWRIVSLWIEGFDTASIRTCCWDRRGEELNAETLRALLDFVSDQTRAERETRYQRKSQLWVVVGVAIAATASVAAATIQAFTS
jgi:hypothetical protein